MSSRDRHSRRRNSGGNSDNWKNKNNSRHGERDNRNDRSSRNERNDSRSFSSSPKKAVFHSSYFVSNEQIRRDEEAIRVFKSENQQVCPKCGKPILELASAITDRGSGTPIHFDCALEMLNSEENLAPGEKIAYIGQGRFGVISYANPHDTKHFTIKKIIDWEEKDKKPHWRDTMAELYSRVK